VTMGKIRFDVVLMLLYSELVMVLTLLHFVSFCDPFGDSQKAAVLQNKASTKR